MKELKRFLQENYPNKQAFNTANWTGDAMNIVYNKDGIQVFYCEDYDYIEIFGINPYEFKDLIDKENRFSMLRTFTEDEMK